MGDDPKSAVGHQRTSRRCGYDFDRVYRLRSRIFAIKELGSARKNLERTDQVEDLDLRRGDENDSTRCPRSADGICARTHSFLSAATNLSGAASKVFLSSSEQK